MEKTDKFNMRVSPAFLGLIDEWRRHQPDIPSRAEAIRRLVVSGINREAVEKIALLGLALVVTHRDQIKENEMSAFRDAAIELIRSDAFDDFASKLDGISVSDISDLVDGDPS